MIPLMKVHMPKREDLLPMLESVLYSGMITEGERVYEFEDKLKSLFSFNISPLTTNSGTTALQIAYRCAQVKGKYVLATPMTCTATNMPALLEGGKIIWCDIDKDTGNIDPKSILFNIEKYGSENIACISFVDFAGYPADIDELKRISKDYNIPLIEDAAQSLGAKWNGQHVGNLVDYTCFSFQAIKHLTTVDGGAIIPTLENWEFAKKIKWYGIDRQAVKEATRWHYDIPHWGYKGHMNNVAATIGISQLKYIEDVINKHKENGQFFNQELSNIDGLTTMKLSKLSDPSYWVYMIRVKNRENFAQLMTDAGIGVNVAHVRNDKYTCFNKSNIHNHGVEMPNLNIFNEEYIAIPCGWWLTKEDREYIVKTIKKGW